MHQAQVDKWGEPPKYVSVPDLSTPDPDTVRIKVLAAGAHRVVQSRAAGRHYSSGPLPHVPGIDGVGETSDGMHVYFSSFSHGSMRDYVDMPKSSVKPLPEGLDPVQTAALLNPALSSWMALKARTNDLPQDFSVVILGATSISGRIAITLARHLGAKHVTGVARNKEALDTLGLDASIAVAEDVQKTDFGSLGNVDVILDYYNGPLTIHLLNSLKPYHRTQYVQVGSVSGVMEVSLPGAVLRSKNLTLRGSGPGSWSMDELAAVLPELLEKIGSIPPQPVRVAKLEDIETEWANVSKERVVFVP